MEYETSDLGLVATLHTFGFSYKHLKHNEDDLNRVLFVFEETPELKHAIIGHRTNGLQVPPSTYYQNLKTLKGEINDYKRKHQKS